MPQHNKSQPKATDNKTSVIHSLISGSISSSVTTIVFQPLELVKTRIQLDYKPANHPTTLGKATRSAISLIKQHNLTYLWRGTTASLLRSVPGVGLYYASLNILQTNLSEKQTSPDTASQAFYFGLTARSLVSFILLPVSVIKVRYESGQYSYSSFLSAVRSAYFGSGWTGVTPTILRDSLFSGTYYMCYTQSKLFWSRNFQQTTNHGNTVNFSCGLISGLIASILTNPLDVIKTRVQVDETRKRSSSKALGEIVRDGRLFDGLGPRSLRRALISASTWTFYEILTERFRQH